MEAASLREAKMSSRSIRARFPEVVKAPDRRIIRREL
jgi:hypothetical protein